MKLIRDRELLTLSIFFVLLLFHCYPADPDYQVKPLQNVKHSGFITRDLFQVVVRASADPGVKTIPVSRQECKKNAHRKKDEQTIKILKALIREERNRFRPTRRVAVSKKTPKDPSKQKKQQALKAEFPNIMLNRGEFDWFLLKMKPFLEDYSEKNSCRFVFRVFENGLYRRVLRTHLTKQTIDENTIMP